MDKKSLLALYLNGTYRHKTGTRPPSCLLLENQLYILSGPAIVANEMAFLKDRMQNWSQFRFEKIFLKPCNFSDIL